MPVNPLDVVKVKAEKLAHALGQAYPDQTITKKKFMNDKEGMIIIFTEEGGEA